MSALPLPPPRAPGPPGRRRPGSRPRRALAAFAALFAVAGSLPAAPVGATADYLIDRWETDDGLPENSSTAMVQTPDGYLWFGTFNGLVRFNGSTFTVFDARQTPALPSGRVANLHLDAGGRLWIGTDRAVVIREGETWKTLGRAEGWSGDHVRTFSEGAGVLCLTSFDGRIFRAAGDRLLELPSPPGTGGGYFGHVDPAGRIWVGQAGYFGWWDGERWQASALADEVREAFEGLGTARDGSILVVARQALLRVRDDRIVSRIPLPDRTNGLWRLSEDRDGHVWLGTQGKGAWRVAPDGGTLRLTEADGLLHGGIRFVFQDRERNLWVGSSGGGLVRLKHRTFRSFSPEATTRIFATRAFAEGPAGRMYIAAFGPGVFELDDTGRFVQGDERTLPSVPGFVQGLLKDRTGRLWVASYDAPLRFVEGGRVHLVDRTSSGGLSTEGLFEDSRGRVWIGGAHTVSVFEGGRFRAFAPAPGLDLRRLRGFAEHPATGEVWAASIHGLFRHGAAGWEEVRDERLEPFRDTTCLRFEADGSLWLGGSLHPLRRLWNGRVQSLGEAQGLRATLVGSILDDGRGHRWLGTNVGVLRYRYEDLRRVADRRAAVLEGQEFDRADGLASVECAVSGNSSAVRDRRGRLWFATLKGAARVDPAELRLNTVPPPLAIEEFRIESQRRQRMLLPTRSTVAVEIPSDTYEVKAAFAALSYAAPEKVRYYFRVDGLDSEWNDLRNRRTIYFYRPPPGDYVLRIKAANNDGVGSEREATLAFRVLPEFWRTWWFRGLLGAAGVGLVALGYRWRMRTLRGRQAELRRMNAELESRVQLRTAELARRIVEVEELNAAQRRLMATLATSQEATARAAVELAETNRRLQQANAELEAFAYSVSHDLRAPVRNITGFLELLAQRDSAAHDPEARRFLATAGSEVRRMGRLIDGLLDLSRLSRVETAVERVELGELVAEVREALAAETSGRRVEWRIDALPAVRGDRGLIRQLLVNLLGNALKYTRRRDVAVITVEAAAETGREPPQVVVRVRDNGAGFNPAYREKLFGAFQRLHNAREFEGTGIGLAIVKRIVERHGGRIWAEGAVDQGATFSFTLPRAEPEVRS